MKNFKNLLAIAAIFVLCAVLLNAIVYGMFAFVLWKANPADWGEGGRYFCVCLSLLATATSVGLALQVKSE